MHLPLCLSASLPLCLSASTPLLPSLILLLSLLPAQSVSFIQVSRGEDGVLVVAGGEGGPSPAPPTARAPSEVESELRTALQLAREEVATLPPLLHIIYSSWQKKCIQLSSPSPTTSNTRLSSPSSSSSSLSSPGESSESQDGCQ